MGGDYYDRPVEVSTGSTSGYSAAASQNVGKTYEMHKSMDPKRWATDPLPCNHKHPIVFALDVTGSMGDWSKIIYDKMPMFYGQIMMKNYLEDPAISFCAVGDSTCDKAPLQITEFGQGKEIDQLLSKMYLEGGGGAYGQESYELSAYFYARHCELKDAELPFFFLTGDEDYYTSISNSTLKNLMGIELTGNDAVKGSINTEALWKELMKKYNVFMIKKAPHDGPIMKHWVDTLGAERVMKISTPKACVDIMLGAIALTSGVRTLESYISDMIERGQDQARIDEVKSALKLYASKPMTIVKGELFIDEESKEGPETVKLRKQREECSMTIVWDGVDENYRQSLIAFNKKLGDKVSGSFLCPITGEIFVDPVNTIDGQTYERKAIELWFKTYDTSPLTGVKLDAKILIPNVSLKKLVKSYYESNKV